MLTATVDYSEPLAGGGAGMAELSQSSIAPFLTKLYQIVSAATTDQCITWTAKGDSFVISDPDTFARDILPTYFKHNNIRSFIRQLNTYGFRKRTNISSTDEHLEFFHQKFHRDEPNLLMQIKRCHQPKAGSGGGGGGGSARGGGGGMGGMGGMDDMGLGGGGGGNDLDTIRTRVGELKSRLGSLQSPPHLILQLEHSCEPELALCAPALGPGRHLRPEARVELIGHRPIRQRLPAEAGR